jgi:hypothetical protein
VGDAEGDNKTKLFFGTCFLISVIGLKESVVATSLGIVEAGIAVFSRNFSKS